MLKSEYLILAFLALPFGGSNASAQNNLTAKASLVQPQPSTAAIEIDRSKDGLIGPVRRVRTEVAKLSIVNGQPKEEKRVALEAASYDAKGHKTDNQYFPVGGSTLTGKEVYKYDDKGNISEMTSFNSDGSLLSKEVYKYEYDQVGNWTRMMTSVAVVEDGKITFEPSEVTYRLISYYLDAKVAGMVGPATNASLVTAKSPAVVGPTPQPISVPAKQSDKIKVSPALPTVRPTPQANSFAASSVLLTASTAGEMKAASVDVTEPPPRPIPKKLSPISGGVLNASAISLPTPFYPDAAKRTRTGGSVIVDVVIDETGKVISAQAISGPAVLRDAAVQAALKARFSPSKLSGVPVRVIGSINYKFNLQQ